MKRKSLVTLLVGLLLSILTGTALADGLSDQIIITPYYTYVSSVFADLSISGNTATCTGSAKGSSANNYTAVTVTLQRRSAGASTWVKVDSWKNTGDGRDLVKITKKKSISSGYSYRVKVSCVITNAQGVQLENPIKHSDVISKQNYSNCTAKHSH
jgi:hypothetical protein